MAPGSDAAPTHRNNEGPRPHAARAPARRGHAGYCLEHWPLALFAWAVVLILLAAASGCKGGGFPNPLSWFGVGGDQSVNPAPPAPADPFWFLTPLAGALVTFGVVALILSVMVPLIPRKAAVTAIACGIAAGVLKAFLVKFLGPVLWISAGLIVVGGAFALWPWIKAAQNWSLNRLGHKLATNGNREAGVALMSTARGLTAPSSWIGSDKVSGRKGRRALAHREQRRALLAKFTPERFTPDPV